MPCASKAPAARWLVDDEGDEEKVLHPTDDSEPETEGRESSSSSESSDDDSTSASYRVSGSLAWMRRRRWPVSSSLAREKARRAKARLAFCLPLAA